MKCHHVICQFLNDLGVMSFMLFSHNEIWFPNLGAINSRLSGSVINRVKYWVYLYVNIFLLESIVLHGVNARSWIGIKISRK